MMKGKFITFEGGEGAGKTTHLKRLAHQLKLLGQRYIVTREPGGTSFGESIRALFLEKKLDLQTENLLILAARRQHLYEIIIPALEKDLWVLSDRYIDSHMVYQALVYQKSHLTILSLHKTFNMHLLPHLTFLFQEPVKRALHRRRARDETCNRFDHESLTFHQKVRKGFNFLARAYPQRIVRVPACRPLRDGTAFLLNTLKAHWPQAFNDGSKNLYTA